MAASECVDWVVLGRLPGNGDAFRMVVSAEDEVRALEIVRGLGLSAPSAILEGASDKRGLLRLAGLAALFVLLLWGMSLGIAVIAYNAKIRAEGGSASQLTNLGAIGDSFGAANALFSGLAFVGVIVAIVMQKSELSLQRRDLRLQYAESVKSTAAHESNAESALKQLELAHQSLDYERSKEPKKMALDLFVRWQELRAERNAVRSWLCGSVGVDDLPSDARDWGEVLKERPGAEPLSSLWRSSTGGEERRRLHDSSYAIINFFERWCLLEQAGEIDREMMRKMMMAHPEWWRGRFVRVLYIMECDDSALIELLGFILEGPLSDIPLA